MEVDFEISEALALAAQFEAAGTAAPVKAASITRHYGQLLHSAVVARAPGTDYPGTIRMQNVTRGSFVGVAVGTDREDGFRRELGFHGLDAKRRMYQEAGKAHFGPGFDEVASSYEEAMGRIAEP